MVGTVVTLSGAIGTLRSDIAVALANRLSWPRVKFSDFIKAQLEVAGGTPEDRRMLQKVGQELVQTDVEGFVAGVLAQANGWKGGDDLVVDGLRHVEVRLALLNAIKPSTLYYVHVEVDEPTRQRIAESIRGIQERLLYRYDQDLTEAQLPKILPAYADQIVDGSLPAGMLAEKIVARLRAMGRLS